MLNVHHIIALLQLGEINIESRFQRGTMATLHSPGALNFIAAKNFRVTHHNPLFIAE